MKKHTLSILVLVSAVLIFNCISMYSDEIQEDRTLSPYFRVITMDTGTRLPLLETTADARIAGVIADITVRQVYTNTGKVPIEAVYVFPASTRAAVYGMTMTICDRIIEARIDKKAKARETYEKAKTEGRSASLLEQARPNVFTMNVANIMPGDTIVVVMKYTELLVPQDGVYEFVYPTVVGPRYSNGKESESESPSLLVSNQDLKTMPVKLYKFDIRIVLDAGIPLSEVGCKTHHVNFNQKSVTKGIITLDPSEHDGGNRDFILDYMLQGDRIQTGLLLSKGEDENFFLLMLQPPKNVKQSDLPLREFIFILDVSGSMGGFPIDVSKTTIRKILEGLDEKDKFNILLFAGSSSFYSDEPVEADKDNIDKALKFIDNIYASGGTELLPALKQALSYDKEEGYSRIIAILTDGYVTVEKEAFDLVKDNLGKANFFAFGIGSSVNRYLIEGLARCGMGESFIVLKPDEAEAKAEAFMKYISSPVMTDIKIEFEGFKAYDVEPQKIPDVTSGRPILVFGKWRDLPTGSIKVIGNTPQQPLMTYFPVNKFSDFDTSQALKYLWARHKISELSDYASLSAGNAIEEEITNLGLTYNLLTKYTSFVAVDYNRKNNTENSKRVVQPSPEPEGVSMSTPQYYVSSSQSYGSSGGILGSLFATSSEAEADPLCPTSYSGAIYIGPIISYNRDLQKGVSLILSNDRMIKNTDELGGNGYQIGLISEWPVSKFSYRHSITFSLAYQHESGYAEDAYSAILKSANNKDTILPVSIKTTSDFLKFDILYNFRIIGTLGISTGFSPAFRLNSTIESEIDLPEGTTFNTAENPALEYKSKQFGTDDLRTFYLGLKFQIFYEFIMGGKFYISPFYGYELGLISVQRDSDWRVNHFNAGVRILFAL